jgi:hypothetical protein
MMRNAPSRKALTALLIIVPLVIAALVGSFWKPQDPPLFPQIPESLSASQSYIAATDLLRQCKYTVYAIALLEHAIKLDPNNPDYHVALGCAYTNRAATLYRALVFQDQMASSRAEFLGDLFHWEIDRFNKDAWDYDSPRPVEQPFHLLHLKDDGTPYHMTERLAVKLILALNVLTRKQFQIAEQQSGSASKIANVCYYNAWSTLVFSRMRPDGGDNDLRKGSSPKTYDVLTELPSTHVALVEINRSLRLAPNTSDYWQSAGDIADEDEREASDEYGMGGTIQSQSRPYYLESLNIQPINESLWMNLAMQDWRKNPTNEQQELAHAAQSNPNNAFDAIMCAGCILEQTAYNLNFGNSSTPGDKTAEETRMVNNLSAADKAKENEAVDWAGRAVTCPKCDFVSYEYSSPSILKVGYTYTFVAYDDTRIGPSFAQFRNAARVISGVAQADGIRKRPHDGLKIAQGLALAVRPACKIGELTRADIHSGNLIKALVAEAVESIALRTAKTIDHKYGTTQQSANADKTYSDWASVVRTQHAKVEALLSPSTGSSEFDIYSLY